MPLASLRHCRNFLYVILVGVLSASTYSQNLNSTSVSLEQCQQLYGERNFIPEKNMFEKYPPHLISLPGSGNSWVRLLVEYATGIYTGSMDTLDLEYLLPGRFEGERACGIRMSLIRGHPHFFDFHRESLRFKHHYQREKCKRGLIREMKRIILLTRNPYDSLWSYYQLLYSLSHSGYVTKQFFQVETWNFFGPHIAKGWNMDYHRVVLPAMQKFMEEQAFHHIRYEDLLNPMINIATLQKLLKFMNYDGIPNDRVACAFLLADKPFAHRRTDDPERVTAFSAYHTAKKGLKTKGQERSLLCQLQEHFSQYSERFNYTLAPLRYPELATMCTLRNVQTA